MAQGAHLITVEQLRKLGRPLGRVDNNQLNAYIEEAENLFVKPCLGESLYLKLLYGDYDQTDPRYNTLLNGGYYNGDGKVIPMEELTMEEIEAMEASSSDYHVGEHHIMGLRVAISYFVYAQNIMTGDYQSSRFGMVVKDNEYSQRLSSRERSDAYNNALEVANTYILECLRYAKSSGLIAKKGRVKGVGSVRIKRIG